MLHFAVRKSEIDSEIDSLTSIYETDDSVILTALYFMEALGFCYWLY